MPGDVRPTVVEPEEHDLLADVRSAQGATVVSAFELVDEARQEVVLCTQPMFRRGGRF